MKFIKFFVIILLAIILGLLFSPWFGFLYYSSFPFESSGSFIGSKSLVGIPIGYTFFIVLFFTFFGGIKKYWWMGVLLLPALFIEVLLDLRHIYFPIIIGLLGWLLAQGVLAVKVRVGK